MAGSMPIPDGANLKRVATGAAWSEGPLWYPTHRVVRWSDIPGSRVLEYDPQTRSTREYRADAEYTNGRAAGPDGSTIVCSHGRRAVERWHDDGSIEMIVDRWRDARLNSPNDVAVHSDGSIWFTDPDYGIRQPHEGHPGEQEYGGCFVFRVDDDGIEPVITTGINRPNGIAFSPDESRLFVTDTAAALGDGDAHSILVCDIDGTKAGMPRLFADVSPGVPDGIAVDVEGRVWSSGGDGVHVFSAGGEALGKIPVPEVVGNLCFADDGNLYIAATTSLYAIPTTTRGTG